MKNVQLLSWSAILAWSFAGLQPGPVMAQSVAEFYKGKDMQMIIRTAAGGGYDGEARLLARHIIKYIPGGPANIIPVNMPGAGGIKAANYVGNVAPKNGTVLTIVGQGLPMYQALQLGKLQVDFGAFNWIGSLSDSNQVLVTWHTSPTKTIEDAKRRETIIGATGAGSNSVNLPAFYNNVIGTKFKIIYGYTAGVEVDLAMERGEVEGRGANVWAGYHAATPHFITEKKINVILQVGLRKEVDLPHVPLLQELANDPGDKPLIDFLSKSVALGWPFAMAPGVPADRVQAIRAAFDRTMQDAEFLADAKRQNMAIDPIAGAELEQRIKGVVYAQQDIRDKVKVAIQPKGADKKTSAAMK